MLSSISTTIIYYSAQKHQKLVAVVNFAILSPQQEGNPKIIIKYNLIFQGIEFQKPHGHFPNFEDEGGKERMVACTRGR